MSCVEDFLCQKGPLIDVRSPCEYEHAHIPGAVSIPLFSDEERSVVGTTYKKEGHDSAVLKGMEIVGPKMAVMASAIRAELSESVTCRVTCFRGGMRSRSVQWLCEFLGFSAFRLEGGYKAFRNHVLKTFERPWVLKILGGSTGSGKTELLEKMRSEGFQVLDLEGIARHRGSTFGLMPGSSQPSSEQFENVIATQLWEMDPHRPIFIEDESRLIGTCVIPTGLYKQMDEASLFWLEVDRKERLKRIVALYGNLDREWLIERASCLKKRLGGEKTRLVVDAISSGDIPKAAEILLDYYDKAYLNSRARHPREMRSITEEELLVLCVKSN